MLSQVENLNVNLIIDEIYSKGSLRQNIDKISLGKIRNYSQEDSKYNHEVKIFLL